MRTVLGTAAVLGAAGLVTAAPAGAHVHVDADNPSPGGTAVVTFRVPGESDTGASTTQLRVDLPGLTSVRTEVMPGWTAHLDRDVAAGTVRSVTWTAAPGAGITSDQFALFKVSIKLPTSATVDFPTTQTYSDGTVVHWDQAPAPDGSEPERPAPQLTLSGAVETATPTPTSMPAPAAAAVDDSARWLAGGALIVAAVAVVAALRGRRRS